MKEWLLVIITAIFPAKKSSDSVGYCQEEFIDARQHNGHYVITHWSQGTFTCDKETYDFFTGKTSHPFQTDNRVDGCHVRNIHKWEYSWSCRIHITLAPDSEHITPHGCWNRREFRN